MGKNSSHESDNTQRESSPPKPIPTLDLWQRLLAESRGEQAATELVARIQALYDGLYAERPSFEHSALRKTLEENILPGLSLYQTLREESADQDVIETEWTTLYEAGFGRLRYILPVLRYIPAPFAVFRLMFRQVLKRSFPTEGWEVELVEDSGERFAFTVRRCFYLDVLTSYGAPELTRLFCNLDDLAFAALPPSIAWARTTTLGRGGDYCDFLYLRTNRTRESPLA